MGLADLFPKGYLVAHAWRKWFDTARPPFDSIDDLCDWKEQWNSLVRYEWAQIGSVAVPQAFDEWATAVLGFWDDPKHRPMPSRFLWDNADKATLRQITAERKEIAKALAVSEYAAGVFVLTGWQRKGHLFQRLNDLMATKPEPTRAEGANQAWQSLREELGRDPLCDAVFFAEWLLKQDVNPGVGRKLEPVLSQSHPTEDETPTKVLENCRPTAEPEQMALPQPGQGARLIEPTDCDNAPWVMVDPSAPSACTAVWPATIDDCTTGLYYSLQDIGINPVMTPVTGGAAIFDLRGQLPPLRRLRLRPLSGETAFDWQADPDAEADAVQGAIRRVDALMRRPRMPLHGRAVAAEPQRAALSGGEAEKLPKSIAIPDYRTELPRTYFELKGKTGRRPTNAELAELLGVDESTVKRRIQDIRKLGDPWPPRNDPTSI